MMFNPISFVVAVPWDGFRQVAILDGLVRNKTIGYGIYLFWLAGSCMSILKIFWDMKNLQREVMAATDVSDARTTKLFEERKRELGIKRPVMLRTINANISPMIAIARTPIIVVPKVEISESSLRLVLDHELNHLKYKDNYVKALAYIVRAVFWWFPFSYVLVNQMEEACELTCDYRVLKGRDTQTSLTYSQTILDFAKSSMVYHKTFGVAALSNNILVRRFELMLKPRQPIRRWLVLGTAILITLLSFLEPRSKMVVHQSEVVVGEEFTVVERMDGYYDLVDENGMVVFSGINDEILAEIIS